MIILFLYLLLLIGFLAGKDGSSYLLKNKTDDSLTSGRIKRWHRDGVILMILGTAATFVRFDQWINVTIEPYWWQAIILASILRVSIFDLLFNKYASLNIHYLGGTALSDKVFVKIFGINGAVTKAVFLSWLIPVFFILKAVLHF